MSHGSSVSEGLRQPLDRLADPLPIPRAGGPFHIEVRPPGSKSLSNRALLLAALATGESTIRGALTDADDGRVMIEALRALGAGIDVQEEQVCVRGVGGRFRTPRGGGTVSLGNSGTAMRFLAAACALADGPVTLDGDPRMHERPIGELAEALGALRVRVEWLQREGFPPLRVIPPRDGLEGGDVGLARTRSGQFVSAILLAAPFTHRGVLVRCPDGVTSAPYVEMTLRLLERVGVRGIRRDGSLSEMFVPGGGMRAFEIDVESDASGAGYFWAAAAMVGRASANVLGVPQDSLQGDARIVDVLAAMGATWRATPRGVRVHGPATGLRAVDADLSGMPDAAMTIAAAACVAKGTTRLRGLRTLRDKETDRLEALRVELSRLGAGVRIERAGDDEALIIDPASVGPDPSPVVFDTYQDHRMAMSLALLGVARGGVSLRDPACVAKTYPGFWADLSRVYEPEKA